MTDHPVELERRGENGTASVAQPVKMPAAVCGTIEDFEDVDCYRISGKKGDDLVAQIFAQRVDAVDSLHGDRVSETALDGFNAHTVRLER